MKKSQQFWRLEKGGKLVLLIYSGVFALLGLISLSLLPSSARMQNKNNLSLVPVNNELDETFGIGGKVATSFPGGLDTAEDVALQTDGKIVVAGSSGSDFALVRYNTNGSLDSSFGTGGKVNTDFPPGQGGTGYALAIQADGKIIVAGAASDPNGSFSSVFALARYNANGTLDNTFDGDGRVTTEFAGSSATARAIVLQADGKIVVAGVSTDNTTFNSVYALARYNTDGSLDTSFDGDGRVTTDFAGVTFEEAHGVAIQTDGKIVAAGLGSSSFTLARYNADGTPDNSFDGDGRVTTAFGGTFESAEALAVQADGKIIAAGQTARSVAAEDNFALARYNTDGSLDSTFDMDGKVTTDFGLVDAAGDVAIQTDGRIIAVGRAGTIPLGSFFAAARYNADGTLDTNFDTDGKVTTDFSGGRFGLGALGVALQTDGRIVAAGDANISGQRDFGVVRYNTTGALDTNFDGDGKAQTDFALNEDSTTALLIQPDGKIVAAGRAQLQVRIKDTQDPNFQLARYNATGALDSSFGAGGIISTDFGTHGDDFANAAALQADGKIVVAGQTGANFSQIPSADTSFGIARYNTDGSPDATFDGDGLVTTDFGATHDSAFAIAVQADGKIVVAGTNGTDFALARYNSNGSPDTGFDMDGKLTTDFGGTDSAAAVAIQADGKIVAAGTSAGNFALARYNADGTPDMSFDMDGKVTTDFSGGSDAINDLIIQADGKIVAAGAATNPGTDSDFALARYTATGALDSNFGAGGKVSTDFGGFDQANALAMQPGGRIVAAGFFFVTANSNPPFAYFALAGYNTNGTPDTNFGAGGKLTTDFFGINNQANAIAVQTDGKIVAGGLTDTGSSLDFALARYTSGISCLGVNRTEFDFDGDKCADISIFRPNPDPDNNYWYILKSSTGTIATFEWGIETDKPAPADYDGDGRTDFAVWRENELPNNRALFYIYNSSNNTIRIEEFGLTGDRLRVGDWDGDGRADLSVYREGAQSFFFYRGSLNNPNGNVTYIPWGTTGDRPMPGDFDGDGKADAAVFRSSDNLWYIRQSSNGQVRYESWGLSTDKFVPADYDGDGKADLAVYRNGTWYIKQSSTNQPRYEQFGLSTDTPVPADYDGDGRADVGVWRPSATPGASAFWILGSTRGAFSVPFGQNGDYLVANFNRF